MTARVVFGSCKFTLDTRPNRGHVEHTLLYLAGILSKSGERDVPGGHKTPAMMAGNEELTIEDMMEAYGAQVHY